MATPHFKRKPKSDGALGDGREVLSAIGHIIKGKLLTLQVMPALVVGAAAIGGAVGFGREMLAVEQRLETFTDRGNAVVEGVWWRLDFNPEELPQGASNWVGFTKPSFCVRLRRSDLDPNPVAVSCLHYSEILDHTQAPYQLRRLPGGRSAEGKIPWRNVEGALYIQLHVPEAGWRWLTETASVYQPYKPRWRPQPGIGADGDLSYWQLFRAEFERPELDLVSLWQESPALPVAVDTRDPGRFMPVGFVESEDHTSIAPFIIGVGLFGAIFWSVGLTLMFPTTRKRAALIVVLTLACAPWWGQWVWRGLDLMVGEASTFGRFIQNVMVPLPPAVEIMPARYDGEPGDQRSPYSLADSIYAPLFEAIEFEPPAAPMTESEAIQAAQAQVKAAMDAMAPETRAIRFVRLACFAAAGLWGAGDLFLPAGEAWKDDPGIGPAATRFLDYQGQPGFYPNHSMDCDAVMGR